MIKDIYYQHGFPDPIFDDDYVLSLVRPFVPEAKKVTGVDETGGEARTYSIDDNIILKVQRPQQLRLSTSLEKEVFFLKQLAEYDSSISVPRVLGYAKEGTLEYTIMTRMPGKAVRYSELNDKQRESMYFELGKTLRRIHSIDKAPFIESGLFPDIDKPSDMKARLQFRFNRVLGWRLNAKRITEADVEWANGQALPILENVPDAEIIVPLHANPGAEHVFVNEDGTFSGVIDFGDSYISHPICDFRSTPIQVRNMLLAGYVSEKEISENFKLIWNAAYELDSIIDAICNK